MAEDEWALEEAYQWLFEIHGFKPLRVDQLVTLARHKISPLELAAKLDFLDEYGPMAPFIDLMTLYAQARDYL